ncbi:TPA: site-specific integrase [Bacillus cereus]|nr:site-specific integrase [Bacillus cereus]
MNGRLGYSLREAQTITKKAYELSPFYGAMYEVLTFAGPRLDELRGVKWRQLDLENNRIYLDDPNQTKGSRPRFIPIPEKTSAKLKELMDVAQPQNTDTRIWGSKLTEASLRKLTKHCCSEGKIGYSGIHDFRRSAVEYHMRELKKEYEKKGLTKADIVNRILDHVGVDDRLNPIVPKTVKNGYITITRKDGTTFRKAKREVVEGEFERKYRFEELITHRIDFLMNTLIAETLGHNRTDSTSPYKNG